MLLSLISGLILTVTGVIFARYFLIWMKTPAEILDLATTYLKIYFLGMPAMMIYNFGSAILRAIRRYQTSVIFSCGSRCD